VVPIHSGMVELTAGDPVAAERDLRTGDGRAKCAIADRPRTGRSAPATYCSPH